MEKQIVEKIDENYGELFKNKYPPNSLVHIVQVTFFHEDEAISKIPSEI